MRAAESDRRLRLLDRLLHLPEEHLDAVERLLTSLSPASAGGDAAHAGMSSDWSHAPPHRTTQAGAYIVTAATLNKDHLFRGAERLDYLHGELLAQLPKAGWELEAWAVFSNHYHVITLSRPDATPLAEVLKELHRSTSIHVNQLDAAPGRQSWYQYWDTQLTYEASYIARLCYVHQNPVKHGLVRVANQYRWCSAAWFERTAPSARVKAVYGVKTDRVRIEDDFDPV